MKQLQISDRDREVLAILNAHFKLNLAAEELEKRDGIEKILKLAWEEYPDKLHDLGIPMFKIAQMYKNMLGVREFLNDFISWRKVSLCYWVDYA